MGAKRPKSLVKNIFRLYMYQIKIATPFRSMLFLFWFLHCKIYMGVLLKRRLVGRQVFLLSMLWMIPRGRDTKRKKIFVNCTLITNDHFLRTLSLMTIVLTMFKQYRKRLRKYSIMFVLRCFLTIQLGVDCRLYLSNQIIKIIKRENVRIN